MEPSEPGGSSEELADRFAAADRDALVRLESWQRHKAIVIAKNTPDHKATNTSALYDAGSFYRLAAQISGKIRDWQTAYDCLYPAYPEGEAKRGRKVARGVFYKYSLF